MPWKLWQKESGFTGGGKEFTNHYNLKERININALPDVESLVNELSFD
jgi:hypothetical protein